MPHFILSPCGTSILTNGASPELRAAINQNANAPTWDAIAETGGASSQLSAYVEERKQALSQASPEHAVRMSAELNALVKFYDGNPSASSGQPDVHRLVVTDTVLGRATGSAIAARLESWGHQVEVWSPSDLRTQSVDEFQTALSELARRVLEDARAYRKSQHRVVFNLTGGFKSIQGYLQALAMLEADETIYVFESGSELLRIPRLPVRLDTEGEVRQHLALFRRLALQPIASKDVAGISEALLFRLGEEVTLSPWGEVAFADARRKIYSEGLLPSPSTEIVFSDGFEKSTQGLEADRYRQLNERLDDLAGYLASGRQKNIKRLDYKALQGKPRPPATHEFDAWADNAAQRVFCRQEGSEIHLLQLDKKLL